METKPASNAKITPRISDNVAKMTVKELRSRISYLAKYMRGISPRVSKYASLARERVECEAQLEKLYG